VHLSVRAESKHGKRLNPRKPDLHRRRETFAKKLRGHGIEGSRAQTTTSVSRMRRAMVASAAMAWRLYSPPAGKARCWSCGL
jgi:hypothetical protein